MCEILCETSTQTRSFVAFLGLGARAISAGGARGVLSRVKRGRGCGGNSSAGTDEPHRWLCCQRTCSHKDVAAPTSWTYSAALEQVGLSQLGYFHVPGDLLCTALNTILQEHRADAACEENAGG